MIATDPGTILAVVAAGLGAGILTSSVGVASLLSFPVLLAIGLPPVVANVSNTLGLIAAGVSGCLGYREELNADRALAAKVIATNAVGALGGAALLLALPSEAFERVVPWLILLTCLLVATQPWISARVRAHVARRAGAGGVLDRGSGHDVDHGSGQAPEHVSGRGSARAADHGHAPRTAMSPATTFFATLVGVYGGYFGAGSGAMMVAVLGFGLDVELRIVNALKTLSVFVGNVVAGVVFALIADVDWSVVAWLSAGSIAGGYIGARVARRIPAPLLRGLIVAAGLAAAVSFLR
ncbi:sulfite exporter TauE/SafE family protein [Agilicoccus flavus]|uniref:sulfite exporter TauE/SafE family protein n=1 Tax=Agilicoccus flavus TaxID=2775968 RepID=UPI001CF70301|nr:sulfite exporter TauE/SafE family protein [Agilicoccus flavus]